MAFRALAIFEIVNTLKHSYNILSVIFIIFKPAISIIYVPIKESMLLLKELMLILKKRILTLKERMLLL